MKKRYRKTFTVVLSVALCFMLAIGVVEIVGMANGPVEAAQTISSGGDGGDGGGGGSGGGGSSKPVDSRPSMSISGKTVKVDGDKLTKKKIIVNRSKIIKFICVDGNVSYKLSGVNKNKKYFSINKGKGNLTLKKGLPAGTYKVKIRVKSGGGSSCKPGTETVTATVKVSKVELSVKQVEKDLSVMISDLEAGNKVFAKSDLMKIKFAGGKTTFRITSVTGSAYADYFAIADNGDLTVISGIPVGEYTVKIQVKTSGNKKYKGGKKTLTYNVSVTPAEV